MEVTSTLPRFLAASIGLNLLFTFAVNEEFVMMIGPALSEFTKHVLLEIPRCKRVGMKVLLIMLTLPQPGFI